MYKSLVITVLVLVVAGAALAAQPDEFGTEQPGYLTQLDEILLVDGTLLRGTIVSESEEVVILETESMGRLEIPRNNIDRVVRGHERIGFETDPDYNSLMFCPTPATLEARDSYFRDFELFVLNWKRNSPRGVRRIQKRWWPSRKRMSV